MNREPSLIDLSTRVASDGDGVAQRRQPRAPSPVPADGSDVPATWRRARRKCAAYLAGLSTGGGVGGLLAASARIAHSAWPSR